ncbi:Hypothetical predicted protein [Paramuricea clavata]|uniref:Uncharacterized protein n=1 Tax=Paramuricea clavata TaxID=317549 RepID=A0A6S7FT25_PARCT|nr:Hypothetical predicted protein [Paramuricea clavata]
MSESESDQDLNVSQYDVEDDLNAYGSPTYKAQEAAVCRTHVIAKVVANATVENDRDAHAEEHKCADRCSCERRQVEFIGTLTVGEKDKVLLELLSNYGKGTRLDTPNV